MTWLYLLGACTILVLVILTVYCYKKSKHLRLLGYDFVYYYMNECNKLTYYRDKDKHIATKFEANYNSLVSNRNKWFLFFGTKYIIENLINFYEKANLLTNKAAPFFSLNHYFAHSECMKFKKMVNELEKLMESVVTNECRKYVEEEYGDPFNICKVT